MATKFFPSTKQPGKVTFAKFLKENGDLFNLSEIERQSGLPSGTLRHVRAGTRDLYQPQYESVRKILCAKLCEMIIVFQHYD